MQNKKVVKTQTYTIKTVTYEDGTSTVHRKNDGFPAFELWGLLKFIIGEVVKQINREFQPDVIKREVVKD